MKTRKSVTTPVDSIKNPLSGSIYVPSVGEIIMDEDYAKGQVITTDAVVRLEV